MEKIRKNSRSRCPYQQGSLFGDDESAALMTGGINTRGRSKKRLSELDTPLEISNDTGSFRFISFGSGSSGNCSYIGNEHGGFLIDAGVDIKTVLAEMEKNNIRPESLLGICLTPTETIPAMLTLSCDDTARWRSTAQTGRSTDCCADTTSHDA